MLEREVQSSKPASSVTLGKSSSLSVSVSSCVECGFLMSVCRIVMLSVSQASDDDNGDDTCLAGNTSLQGRGTGNKRGNTASPRPTCQGQLLSLSLRASAGANRDWGMDATGSSPPVLPGAAA